MIKIVSASGDDIKFSLNAKRKLVIGKDPIDVDESEYTVLESRLGNQIRKVIPSAPESEPTVASPEEKVEETETSEPEAEKTVEPTESTEPEEVKEPAEEEAEDSDEELT